MVSLFTYKKVLDTVNHVILQSKFVNCVFRGCASLEWFGSCLADQGRLQKNKGRRGSVGAEGKL